MFWPCKPGVSPAAAVNHISHGYSEPLRGCDDSRFVHFVYFPSQEALAVSGVTNRLVSRREAHKSSARSIKKKGGKITKEIEEREEEINKKRNKTIKWTHLHVLPYTEH